MALGKWLHPNSYDALKSTAVLSRFHLLKAFFAKSRPFFKHPFSLTGKFGANRGRFFKFKMEREDNHDEPSLASVR